MWSDVMTSCATAPVLYCLLLSSPQVNDACLEVYYFHVLTCSCVAFSCPQVNDVNLQGAEHHTAVEALRSSGSAVTMTVLRERMVEPENAITTTPLRPEDDYFPRERRCSGVPFSMEPGSPASGGATPNPNTYRLTTCLLRNDKGLGFSIAGGKGSTPYRTGDTVRQLAVFGRGFK